MAKQFPQVKVQPLSGLSFPWSEATDSIFSKSDQTLGPDGVTFGMVMYVNWADLFFGTVLQELLGYSYRTVIPLPAQVGFNSSTLHRNLPWQNPMWDQLYVKRIASVKGIGPEGKASGVENVLAGLATEQRGLTSAFDFAQLTIEFWRPPYFVRSDDQIPTDFLGRPKEWLRYFDKQWTINTQMFAREGQMFVYGTFDNGTGTFPGPDPTGSGSQLPIKASIASPISKVRLQRKWYEIPEACLFSQLGVADNQDVGAAINVPEGIPFNQLYMQTPTTNPITGYTQDAIANPRYFPITGTVNSPIGGNILLLGGVVSDLNPLNRFLGFFMGTLQYLGCEYTPRPLQMPAYLMNIPAILDNEPMSQTQYDVLFNFQYFDPPRPAGFPIRGFNLMPFAGDCMWYPAMTQRPVGGSTIFGINVPPSAGYPPTTAFQYADFADLFQPL